MRKSKQFWAVTDYNTVELVTGWECNNQESYWWVPDLGFTMTVGAHLFETEREAKSALETEINQKILDLKAALAKLD